MAARERIEQRLAQTAALAVLGLSLELMDKPRTSKAEVRATF